MKSRFFGLSAKLALAVLAVGFTFTSCYDSASDNVVVPVTPGQIELPAPVYEITGYVTDFLTGSAISGATVSTPLGSASTDATGYYKVSSGTAASGTVEISAADYQNVSLTLNITALKTGMASYTVNAALKKDGYVDGVTVNQLGTGSETTVITEGLGELVNDGDATTKSVVLAVKQGARWNKGVTRADNTAFLNYIKAVYGITYVGENFVPTEKTYDINLAANSYVKSITVTTEYVTEGFFMPGEAEANVIDRVLRTIIDPQFVSIDHGHDHDGHDGHDGHGSHGDGSNPGGGVGGAE